MVDNFQKNVNVGRAGTDGLADGAAQRFDEERVLLAAQPSFPRLIEKLLQRSKSDRTESIRIEA